MSDSDEDDKKPPARDPSELEAEEGDDDARENAFPPVEHVPIAAALDNLNQPDDIDFLIVKFLTEILPGDAPLANLPPASPCTQVESIAEQVRARWPIKVQGIDDQELRRHVKDGIREYQRLKRKGCEDGYGMPMDVKSQTTESHLFRGCLEAHSRSYHNTRYRIKKYGAKKPKYVEHTILSRPETLANPTGASTAANNNDKKSRKSDVRSGDELVDDDSSLIPGEFLEMSSTSFGVIDDTRVVPRPNLFKDKVLYAKDWPPKRRKRELAEELEKAVKAETKCQTNETELVESHNDKNPEPDAVEPNGLQEQNNEDDEETKQRRKDDGDAMEE